MLTIRPGIRAIKEMSDEKVYTQTGKSLSEWVDEIDCWDGNKRELLSLIEYLMGRHGLTHLWASTIASYYLIDQTHNDLDS
jgi:hypothetical protein